MNFHNDWENLLKYANEELNPKGYGIRIRKDGDGYYFCDILKDGKRFEEYAGNYFEHELEDLVNDAWGHVQRDMLKMW
jgi:hypothetical protein